MTDHIDRTSNFTNKEFKDLARNDDNDIVEMLTAFIWITDAQRELLSEDDRSRMSEHKEDASFILAELIAEFG